MLVYQRVGGSDSQTHPYLKMIWLVQNLQILTGDAQVQGGAPVSVLSWFATEISWD